MIGPRFFSAGTLSLILSGTIASAQTAPVIHRPRAAPALTGPITILPPAEFDEKLKIGGDEVKAKEATSTRLTVETRVNGYGPYRFVVDSGADTSVVGLGIAHDLRLPVGTPVVLNNMTARNMVDRVRVDQLSFGPSTIHELEVPALSEGDLGGQGMLGIDALVEQRLMLDFDKKVIKVEDARRPISYSPDSIVITARRQRGQLILARVRAGGVPLDAVIDTGSEITVGNLALRDQLLGRGHNDFVTVEVVGVTGVIQKVQITRVRDLQLGPVHLRDVPIAFADLPPFAVFGLSNEPALLLGTDLLSTFRTVSLDFRARKVRFQLRKCSADDVVINSNPMIYTTRLSWNGDAEGCLT